MNEAVADGTVIDWPANPSRSGYAFTGWYTGNGVRYTNVSPVLENLTLYAGWQSARSSSSRSSSGNGSSNVRTTPTTPTVPTQTFTDVTQSAAVEAVNNAVATAGDSAAVTARLQNAGKITLSTMQAMVSQAGGKALTIHADAMNGTAVDVRLYIDPAKAIGDINLAASTISTRAASVKASFEGWFTNKLMAVRLENEGAFGQTVEIAVKLTAQLADSDDLVIYSYDSTNNIYTRIEDQNYRIDSNGYVYFNVTSGGDYIVSAGMLTRR